MREAPTHDAKHTGYFLYPPNTMTLIFELVAAVVVLASVGVLCLLLVATAGAAIAGRRNAKGLAPVPVETEAERMVALHQRINKKERTAQQPLSVWQEEDGFIGTYADDGSRIWGEGIAHPDEPEVLAPGTQYAGPLITEPELVVTGAWANPVNAPFAVNLPIPGPSTVEVRPSQHGARTLYEVRISIDMDPERAYETAKHLAKEIKERAGDSWGYDIAFVYGPWVITPPLQGLWEWVQFHAQYTKMYWERAFAEAQQGICSVHSIPVMIMGEAKPVAYAPSGCQCGVCGPELGPVWENAAKALAPTFQLNRAAVHEMYEERARYEKQKHEREARTIEPMPPELRQVWLDHEGVA